MAMLTKPASEESMAWSGLSMLFFHYAGRPTELGIAKQCSMQICASAHAQLHWRFYINLGIGR
eukprot:5347627-Pyramimonas_sp.AAC.1